MVQLLETEGKSLRRRGCLGANYSQHPLQPGEVASHRSRMAKITEKSVQFFKSQRIFKFKGEILYMY